jgi:hypothetical protein
MAKARSVTEEKRVSVEIDNATAKYPRFVDVWDSWKWRLSRAPQTDAVCIRETDNTMMIKSDPTLSHYGVPIITILYKFTDNEVNILAIKINGSTS